MTFGCSVNVDAQIAVVLNHHKWSKFKISFLLIVELTKPRSSHCRVPQATDLEILGFCSLLVFLVFQPCSPRNKWCDDEVLGCPSHLDCVMIVHIL